MAQAEDKELLIRIDERTKRIEEDISEIKDYRKECNKKFVTKKEFTPVKLISFGSVGFLASIVLAVIVAAIRTFS